MIETQGELRAGLADPSSQYLANLVDTGGSSVSQWLLVATILVMFMQSGFLLLESGSARAKNTINVSQKNVVNMIICGCGFIAFGASVMFGAGTSGWIGFGGFDIADMDTQLKLLFQFAFCATAATIVSGAVAERMTFFTYMLLTAVMAVIIYPVFGHLVWGDNLIAGNPAFLADMGFLDFSGSTVVHAVGGWAALAAVTMIGARAGRFGPDGKINPMPGHSSVLALSGLMILVMGWVGFNTGAATPGTQQFSQIALNTVTAMSFGGAAGMLYDMLRNKGRLRPRATISSILGGLIAITAGCAYVDFYAAMAIGVIGGITATVMSDVLLEQCHIDDPVDAIACHGAAGLVGTLLVAVFAKPEFLVNGSRLDQLVVQATGSVMAFVWAFGVALAALALFKRLGLKLRVSAEEEAIGLNLSEHGDGFDIESLKGLLGKQKADALTPTVPVSYGEANVFDGIGGEAIDETSGYDRNATLGLLGEVVGNAKAVAKENQDHIARMNDIEKVGSDWLFETDQGMHISRISEKFFKTFGEKARGVIGRSYFDLLVERDFSLERHRNQIALQKTFDDLIFDVMGPDRQTRIFSVSGVPKYNEAGLFDGYRGRASDVTDRVRADEEIRYMALHDHLTGLKNRAAFDKSANLVLQDHGRVLIGTIDLDGFKSVNDSYGHHVGDALLKLVATRLSMKLGPNAVVSRFGGDEFVFALPLLSADWHQEISNKCASLIDGICAPALLGEIELFVGGSLGVAVYPDHQITLPELLRCSDMALYEAKQAGRGQWSLFSQELEDRAKRRKRLESDMPAAIKNQEFFLEYQPQVSADERGLTGFEALVRWQHPEFGKIPPLEFIMIAEETGLIIELGEFVLFEACRAAAAWPSINGKACMISVNVSPVQFFKQDLVELVMRALAETGLDAKRLELEITESALVKDQEDATRVLAELRAKGIRVAVDDFGTGYSSLSFLQQFPLDRLKVDRAFVKNLARGGNDYRIAEAIVQLGKSLGLNVIAEGVETQDQFEKLTEINIDDIQGFLFSPPISTAASLAMIVKANDIQHVFDDCLSPEYPRKLGYAGA